MANTLTNLIPSLYRELDTVSRELTGFIPAVTLDASLEEAALNQTVYFPVAPAATSANNTAAVTPPDTGDQTIGNGTFLISKSKHVPIRWNGEEVKGINTGVGHSKVLLNQFQQAFRTLTNEMNADIAALYSSASRAVGTYNATPFATAGDFSDAANVRKVLVDNGAPQNDLQLVVNTTAGVNMLGKQSRVDIQGTRTLLEQGIIQKTGNIFIRESAGIARPTAGTGASYQLNGALAIGDLTVTVDTGSGTILAGDIVTIGNYNYVVNTALSGGSFTVNAPGIREVVADNTAISVIATTSRMMGFARSALVLATRMPAQVPGGDMATDVTTIVDPVSGIAFEIAEYKQFRQTSYHVAAAWGTGVAKKEHLALLIGNA